MFLGHGYGAVVFSVSRGGRRLALRLRWSPEQTRGEADALAACRAHGTVELVAADVPRGALLLGRLAGELAGAQLVMQARIGQRQQPGVMSPAHCAPSRPPAQGTC
jgi:hypothetical protein